MVGIALRSLPGVMHVHGQHTVGGLSMNIHEESTRGKERSSFRAIEGWSLLAGPPDPEWGLPSPSLPERSPPSQSLLGSPARHSLPAWSTLASPSTRPAPAPAGATQSSGGQLSRQPGTRARPVCRTVTAT